MRIIEGTPFEGTPFEGTPFEGTPFIDIEYKCASSTQSRRIEEKNRHSIRENSLY